MSNVNLKYSNPTVQIETDLRTAALLRELMSHTNARHLGESGIELIRAFDQKLGGEQIYFDTLRFVETGTDGDLMIEVTDNFNKQLQQTKVNL